MERLNLPTVLQGGYDYVDTVILFRRTRHGFEFTVAQRGADQSNPESTEGGRRVSILKWPEGALLNLG